MITLRNDTLKFRFQHIAAEVTRLMEDHIQRTLPRMLAEIPNVRWAAGVLTADRIERELRSTCRDELSSVSSGPKSRIVFQRTLRIPDDGKTYPLPAGLGAFPLRHVDDCAATVPATWLKRGGVMMPMHQSEALWVHFSADYPCAIKVAAGKINAITGESWTDNLQCDPQNYLVVPDQPWLDGFAVGKGMIRQFVAMPLGSGYSVEEQLTGSADIGGIQLQLFPMKAEVWFRKSLAYRLPSRLNDLSLLGGSFYCREGSLRMRDESGNGSLRARGESTGMGLGAGGKMQQEINKDPYKLEDWDTSAPSRCFVHLCNSQVWRQITGTNPPHPPLTSQEYAAAGIPWFDYYRDDVDAVNGSKILNGVKTVSQVAQGKGDAPMHGNTSISPGLIVQYGNTRRPDEVREWSER